MVSPLLQSGPNSYDTIFLKGYKKAGTCVPANVFVTHDTIIFAWPLLPQYLLNDPHYPLTLLLPV